MAIQNIWAVGKCRGDTMQCQISKCMTNTHATIYIQYTLQLNSIRVWITIR